jgi:hypothetical protein
LAITATVGTASISITDPDEDGNLVGSNVTGTMNYATGEWHLTFTGTAPDGGSEITADFTAYTSTTPIARMTAYDCIKAIHGGIGPFQYGIERDAASYGYTPESDPKDAYVEGTCTDILGGGLVQLFVYVHDTYGNVYGPVNMMWAIQDPNNMCGI